MSDPQAPVTVWLAQAADGNQAAADQLASWAYGELERLAAARLRREFAAAPITLEPAALVNETFIKLLENPVVFENRRHFFAFVSKVMLRVMIDYRRMRDADKRGGGEIKLTLSGVESASPGSLVDALALSQALDRLEQLDPRKAEITRLRALWGMELDEIARVVGVAEPTVRRDWRFARTWLAEELDPA